MSGVTETVDVAVPVRTAYNQWTQFEEFPRFMTACGRSASSMTPGSTGWSRSVGYAVSSTRGSPSSTRTSGSPGRRPRARSTPVWSPSTGSRHHSRVTAQLDIEPEGFVENVADKVGMVDRQIKSDMSEFKEFIEQRGTETGAWRGDVERPQP